MHNTPNYYYHRYLNLLLIKPKIKNKKEVPHCLTDMHTIASEKHCLKGKDTDFRGLLAVK
jgi:hypothetical protein